MSYAQNVLRRRQEMERAFRERYNPMEDVVSALSEIDKETFRREQLAAEEERARAEEQRRVERFGLEKIKTEKETQRMEREEQEARDDRAALAEERRARGKEWAAREAEVRQRTKQEEEAAARKAVIEKGYGMMRGAGLPGPGATPVSKKDLDELGAAVGMTADEVLAGIEQLESERSKLGAGLGLIEAKTEKEKAAAEAARRKGIKGPPSAAKAAKEVDEAFKRSLSIQYEQLKIKEKQLRLGMDSGFTLTPEVLRDVQQARIAAKEAQSGMNALRALLVKYPDLETYTGPIDNMEAWVRQKFGAQGQMQAEVRSTIDQVFQAFKRIQTGAAAGNQEMADLKQIMPSTTDRLPAIKGKMAASDNIVREKVSYYDKLLSTRDIRAGDEFATGADIVAPAVAPAAAQMSDDELDQYEVR